MYHDFVSPRLTLYVASKFVNLQICDQFWENVPKHAESIFPDLPIKA